MILKFSLMYLINNVHVAASGIQLPIPLKPAASSNLLINRLRLEEGAGFRGSGSWIPEVAACTSLIRYIRENFKIATFSRLLKRYYLKTYRIEIKAQKDGLYQSENLILRYLEARVNLRSPRNLSIQLASSKNYPA